MPENTSSAASQPGQNVTGADTQTGGNAETQNKMQDLQNEADSLKKSAKDKRVPVSIEQQTATAEDDKRTIESRQEISPEQQEASDV